MLKLLDRQLCQGIIPPILALRRSYIYQHKHKKDTITYIIVESKTPCSPACVNDLTEGVQIVQIFLNSKP